MTSASSPTPASAGATRVRIASHVMQSRFLHVEDALDIGKIRLFAGTYRRGQGMKDHSQHYLDLADARVVFLALALGEQEFTYREYKGTPPANGAVASSRVFSATVKGEKVYLELKHGPGKRTPTGAITPAGPATVEVNVGFKLYEARRLAATVLAYIRAWDVQRMLAHRRQIGAPAPYLQVAAESQGRQPAINGNGPTRSTAGPDRPVSAKTPASKQTILNRQVAAPSPATAVAGPPDPGQAAARVQATAQALYGDDVLRYGDGTLVDTSKSAEVDTFRRYVAQHRQPPASRAALQAFYRQVTEA